jgi:hypothetical protein
MDWLRQLPIGQYVDDGGPDRGEDPCAADVHVYK